MQLRRPQAGEHLRRLRGRRVASGGVWLGDLNDDDEQVRVHRKNLSAHDVHTDRLQAAPFLRFRDDPSLGL